MDLQFEEARAASIAGGVMRDVIHRYKYHRAFWFEPFFEALIKDAIQSNKVGVGWDILVPVPLHPTKLREREFNQAERIARLLGHQTGVPVRTDLVARFEVGETQTRLSRQERAANVHRAFGSVRPDRIEGVNALIIDDVLTTGATTNAVARVLKRLGARRIGVWTLARATLG
jgi:ComF family protein